MKLLKKYGVNLEVNTILFNVCGDLFILFIILLGYVRDSSYVHQASIKNSASLTAIA